jgi:protoporphyrinogen oxidase
VADIVILGAGLTGLSVAYHLERKGFYDYVLCEQDATVGGLCRSVVQDGFTFDYTGHLMHISDDYFRSFIEAHVGFEHFNDIIRRSFIYSQDRYTRYPYQINLYGLPPETIAHCIEGFITRPRTTKSPRSFYSWVLHNFGKGLGEHFFFNYQEKIFSYDVKKLTASWTGRFVPKTSLGEMILGAVRDNGEQEIGYNARFYYPKKGGIFFWIDKLHQQIYNPVRTTHRAISIDLVNKIVHFANGHQEPFKQLITTLPLDHMLGMLKERSHTTLARAKRYLLCNSVVNFNMGIARPSLSTKHWIYFPEKKYPFYRIGFYHNFSSHLVPPECGSLYGEFAYLRASPSAIADTLACAQTKVKQLFHISEHEVITEKVITIPHAYVIFNRWRDRNLPKLLTELEQENIFSIGRYGGWKYASMQEGFLDGKQIVDRLIMVPAQKITEESYLPSNYQPLPSPHYNK